MAGAKSDSVAVIRAFLLAHISDARLAAIASQRFGISRQAVNQHLRNLASEGAIQAEGRTKDRKYRLVSRQLLNESYEIDPQLQEDRVWSRDVSPLLQMLPQNVLNIWNFCFTEMFNNAIDHSEGSLISVYLETNAVDTELMIHDDGVGIFAKIQEAMGLPDQRQAVLELAKGKFTTDKARHSGLGIFFTSRMLDSFSIFSGSVYFSDEAGRMHDLVLEEEEIEAGTTLLMKIANSSTRSTASVFGKFGDSGSLNFNKTVIPVALAQYGNELLISRSQAKRVLARVDQFEHVAFDFSDVEAVGQGFADEIFRVFSTSHPEVILTTIHTNREVHEMIQAVRKEALRQAKADRRSLPIAERG